MQNKFIPLGVFLAFVTTFSAGIAFAGFEWVPPGGKDASMTPTPSGAEPAPLEPVATQKLTPPVPPMTPTAATMPLVSTPCALPVPAPEHVLIAPPQKVAQQTISLPVPTQVPAVSAPKALIVAPAADEEIRSVQAEPQSAPMMMNMNPPAAQAPQQLLKIKTINAEPAPLAAPPGSSNSDIVWNPVPPAPQAPVEKTASQDAGRIPLTDKPPVAMEAPPVQIRGLDQSPVSRKLVINPYPEKGPPTGIAITEKTTTMVPVNAEPLADAPAPAAAPADESTMSKVVGFGSDMPLALALQQIAPSDYTFSFGDNVNPGTKVSWDGANKPWLQVISDSIAPLGLAAELKDHVVHIKTTGGQQQGAADLPNGEDTLAAADDKNLRRDNITDPGEVSKKQPLSTLVEADAQPAPAAATDEAPAIALLPQDALPPPQAPSSNQGKLAGSVPVIRGVWEVHQGDSLKEILGAWSRKANVDLVWNATHDYTVDADITVNDSFATAVQAVIAQGVKADKPVFNLENGQKDGKSATLIIEDKT